MSNQVSSDENSCVDFGVEAGAKKLAENAVNRVFNWVVDGCQSKIGKVQIRMKSFFKTYLENAYLRYNRVKTLVTGTEPRSIIGPDNIYVKEDVMYGKEKISTNSIDKLISINKNVLISGTGGAGKSMLMRYFFLNTVNCGDYIPIFLELRRISGQKSGSVSIMELIRSCMESFDLSLPQKQFEYSLRRGKYLLLMDGLDEVRGEVAGETAEAIQNFCAKYPNNPCIVTSRPNNFHRVLETFTCVESSALTVEQAVELARKLGGRGEKAEEFCRQLENNLYARHKDFAENPLLLSMMYLVFMRNNSIPEHLSQFYKKAYEALYSTHDNCDKGVFHREFCSKTLDETDFRDLFSKFCFRTYLAEAYEFTREEIIKYIEISIEQLGLADVSAEDYLKDLRDVVCMIVEEGEIFRFSHRSFQAYFAACYTSEKLLDEQQKKLFKRLLENRKIWLGQDYFSLLIQLDPLRFLKNALEERLREIMEKIEGHPEEIVEYMFSGLGRTRDNGQIHWIVASENPECRVLHMFALHDNYVKTKREILVAPYIDELIERGIIDANYFRSISFDEIKKSQRLTSEQINEIFRRTYEQWNVWQVYDKINECLDRIDKQRAALEREDFLDSL